MHDLRMIGAVFIARDDQEGFTLGPVSHQKKKKNSLRCEFHLTPMKTVQQQLCTGEGRPTSKG